MEQLKLKNKKEYEQGVACAILCSVLWGFLPIYWKGLEPIDPLMILFCRIVLSFLFALVLALYFYRWDGIVRPMKEKGIIPTFFFAGALISFNWGTYIWAIANEQVIQTCIGYYIEPLLVCIFGILFFKERLNRYKMTAFLLACAGVFIILIYYHEIPVVALSLGISFAVYTAIKKKVKLDAVLALLYETMMLVPVALIATLYLTEKGAAAGAEPFHWGLLALAGIMTGTPLMLFAMAANRIPMITLGILEYISPSITLLLGIFLFKEPFELVRLVTFGMIWVGLVIFTIGEIKESKAVDSEPAVKESGVGTDEQIQIMTGRTGRSETQDRFRFPDGIKRVTAGPGGEALLITGSERTAVIDCGMAYCGEALADNIKAELGDRPLDYVILSHTHYDHIGGLPYLRRVWPGLVSFGAAYGKKVLEKDSVLKQIGYLAETAYELYSKSDREPEVLMEGLKIDRILCENDTISLGDRELHIYETPGHTTCSLSILLEPDGILFPSETTGVYIGEGRMLAGMVKSCRETIESIEKCRKLNAKIIISPHFGWVPECVREVYWDLAMESVEHNREFVLAKVTQGASFEEILEEYTKEFYHDMVSKEQPRVAFLLNAQYMIRSLIKEFRE